MALGDPIGLLLEPSTGCSRRSEGGDDSAGVSVCEAAAEIVRKWGAIDSRVFLAGFLECRLSLLIPKNKKDLLEYIHRKNANLANPGLNKHVGILGEMHCSFIWAIIGTCLVARRYSV